MSAPPLPSGGSGDEPGPIERELLPAEPDPAETARLEAAVARHMAADPADPKLYKVDARGVPLVTLATLASLFALQAAAPFVIPLVVAVLLAYALDPFVSFLARKRVPRWLGALLVLSALLVAIGTCVYALRHQAQSIIDQLPAAVRKATRVVEFFDASPGIGFDNLRRAAEALQRATDQATGNVPNKGASVMVVQQQGPRIKDLFVSGGLNILALFGQLVMVVFLVYFVLTTGNTFKRKFVKVAGRTLSEKKITVHMFEKINLSVQRYLAMLLVTNIVLAILTWAAFRIIGLQNAGTWAIAAGILHVVPYFGPVLICLATGFAALIQFNSFAMALLVGGVTLVIAALVGIVLTTWMTSRIARMNTVAIFVGLLLFGWLWGAWGVLLSVPLVVIVKVICDHVEGLKSVAEFLGD